MTKRLLFIVLLLVLSVGVQAQPNPVHCGDLSADDCAILEESQTAMLELTGATGNLSMDFLIDGFTEDTVTVFTVTGDMAYAGDVSALIDVTPQDMVLISTDPAASAEFMQTLLTSFNGELNMTISMPEDLAEDSDDTFDITLEMRLVDGIGYINLGALAQSLPDDEGEDLPEGWWGIHLDRWAALFARMNARTSNGEAQELMADLRGSVLNHFITVERTEDSVAADGAEVANFVTTVDFGGMMDSDEVQEFMEERAELMHPGMSERRIERQIEFMEDFAQGLAYSTTQSIGLEDHYVRSSTFSLSWDLDAVLRSFVGSFLDEIDIEVDGVSIRSDDGGLKFGFTGITTLDNFNDPPEITVPEDATVLGIQEFFDMVRDR